MSYILDALQRADAERARGGVPTLHARPLNSAAPTRRLGTPQRVGLSIAVVGAVAAVAAAAWWMGWPVAAPVDVVVAPTPAAAPAVALPVATLPPPLAVPASRVAPPAAATASPATAALPGTPSARTAVAGITPPTPSKPKNTASAAELSTPTSTKEKPPAVATAATLPAPAPGLAPLLSELPEALRRQVPAMAISGAVYSDNPAQRLLLVNGQVLNQGSQVTPDLTVVEIHAHDSEFNFRGTRFRVAH